MWLLANGFHRNKSGNVNSPFIPIKNFERTQKFTSPSAADLHNTSDLDICGVRPSTVVHRNRTSPFNKNKHVLDANAELTSIQRADSRDINSKTRSKSRVPPMFREKLMREDLEWFNSSASTQEVSRDDFGYKHI